MELDLFSRVLSNFVERLKELMEDNQKSARTLATDIGVSLSMIYQYLEKKSLPKLPNLLKIADYFNCTTDFLLGKEEHNSATKFLPCPPFSERLPVLLKHFATNKYQLCKKTGIAKSLVYYWQVGEKVPTPEHLVKLAEHYHCSVDFIIGRES